MKSLNDFKDNGKKIILRADLDVGDDFSESDTDKLSTVVDTIKYLLSLRSRLIMIGHRGRPEGKPDGKLSLLPVSEKLSEILGTEIKFIYDIAGHEALEESGKLAEGQIMMLENLRFDGREEGNDEGFSGSLAALGEIYVNEAFSASHREHASIVGIPKHLPSYLGLHFIEEINNLNKVLETERRPVVVLISGVKEDKLEFVKPFSRFADKILIAGRLPDLIERKLASLDPEVPKEKLIIADLIYDKEDITIRSIEKFEKELSEAGTIVVGGPVGKFEEPGHLLGTKRVFETVANSNAFKVAGGGDTEQAIKLLGLKDKFDWISIGGGASLEFLAKGTLPGIKALE